MMRVILLLIVEELGVYMARRMHRSISSYVDAPRILPPMNKNHEVYSGRPDIALEFLLYGPNGSSLRIHN